MEDGFCNTIQALQVLGYAVWPFKLTFNLPELHEQFFRDMLNQFVIIYVDYILIYSPNLEEHQRHVSQVLQRLRQHHLYLKLEKCKFYQATIQFLGYIITPEGVQMDQNKEEAIRNWPQPTTVKELQRFLGFANLYWRFIAHYSQLSAPHLPLSSVVSPRPSPGRLKSLRLFSN